MLTFTAFLLSIINSTKKPFLGLTKPSQLIFYLFLALFQWRRNIIPDCAGHSGNPLFQIKTGIHLKAVFTPPKIGLTEISRSRFKQYKNPTLITQINVLGCFLNFLVIFRYVLGRDSFSQRSSEIWRNKK